MTLPAGIYRTVAGSEMRISGKYAGISEVLFNWCDEPNACPDCVVSAYDEDGFLVWHCSECGGGQATLFPIEEE